MEDDESPPNEAKVRPMSLGRCQKCDCAGFVGNGDDPAKCARPTCQHPVGDHSDHR
jgi:hypothetical protein